MLKLKTKLALNFQFKKLSKKSKEKEDMEDLKKELDMDWHRITWDELCTRLETSTETVSLVFV